MPVINTTDTNNTKNTDIFQDVLNMLLKDKPSQYLENTLFSLMNYLALHTKARTLSEHELDNLTKIHAKFLSFYCTENLHSNNSQTIPDSYYKFLDFSEVLKDKEEFFYLPHTNHQTRIKTDCETILNTDTQAPINCGNDTWFFSGCC